MKKIIFLSLIACTLSFNHNTFGMLKQFLRTQPHVRTCHTTYSYKHLPTKNIFNTPNLSTQDKKKFLEDLYNRNYELINNLEHDKEHIDQNIEILNEQNEIAIIHTYFEEKLDITKLESLEKKLQEKFNTTRITLDISQPQLRNTKDNTVE